MLMSKMQAQQKLIEIITKIREDQLNYHPNNRRRSHSRNKIHRAIERSKAQFRIIEDEGESKSEGKLDRYEHDRINEGMQKSAPEKGIVHDAHKIIQAHIVRGVADAIPLIESVAQRGKDRIDDENQQQHKHGCDVDIGPDIGAYLAPERGLRHMLPMATHRFLCSG